MGNGKLKMSVVHPPRLEDHDEALQRALHLKHMLTRTSQQCTYKPRQSEVVSPPRSLTSWMIWIQLSYSPRVIIRGLDLQLQALIT